MVHEPQSTRESALNLPPKENIIIRTEEVSEISAPKNAAYSLEVSPTSDIHGLVASMEDEW